MTLHKPEHPPLTTNALVSWLKNQPPEQTYVWSDPVFCLIGHYMAANDSSWGTAQYSDLPDYELIAKSEPHTFGAALTRAEALLAPPTPKEAPLPELELQATSSELLPAPAR